MRVWNEDARRAQLQYFTFRIQVGVSDEKMLPLVSIRKSISTEAHCDHDDLDRHCQRSDGRSDGKIDVDFIARLY